MAESAKLSSWDFHNNLLETDAKKTELTPNYPITKKFTIFALLQWNFVKVLSSWVGNITRISAWSERKYGFFVNSQFLGQFRFFAPVFILKLTSMFHHFPRVNPKQLSALAHLGCTCEAGTVVCDWESSRPLLCSKLALFKTSWQMLKVVIYIF